jgi:hypothetical protein
VFDGGPGWVKSVVFAMRDRLPVFTDREHRSAAVGQGKTKAGMADDRSATSLWAIERYSNTALGGTCILDGLLADSR